MSRKLRSGDFRRPAGMRFHRTLVAAAILLAFVPKAQAEVCARDRCGRHRRQRRRPGVNVACGILNSATTGSGGQAASSAIGVRNIAEVPAAARSGASTRRPAFPQQCASGGAPSRLPLAGLNSAAAGFGNVASGNSSLRAGRHQQRERECSSSPKTTSCTSSSSG